MTTNLRTSITSPALLAPNLVENVWGGDWLCRWKGLAPAAKPIGESWEFSAHKDHPGELILSDGTRAPLVSLFAKKAAGLLIKFVDARENLSLQVHPSNSYARRHENASGKSESWLILDAGNGPEDGFIHLGFSAEKRKQFATSDAFAAAFEKACRSGKSAEVLSFVNKFKVKPGDAFHVPPGTVHAVGRGLRFFEIQQSSSLTYRLWDWGRTGRELHLEKAMQVLDFSTNVARVALPERIVDPSGHYEAEVFSMKGPRAIATAKIFYVLTVLEGELSVNPGSLTAKAGQSVFVPENTGVSLAGTARVVRSWTTEPPLSSE